MKSLKGRRRDNRGLEIEHLVPAMLQYVSGRYMQAVDRLLQRHSRRNPGNHPVCPKVRPGGHPVRMIKTCRIP